MDQHEKKLARLRQAARADARAMKHAARRVLLREARAAGRRTLRPLDGLALVARLTS